MHRRQARLLVEAQKLLSTCGTSSDSAVWEDPSTYDLRLHGPPYLPEMTAVDREAIRKEASAKKGEALQFLNSTRKKTASIAKVDPSIAAQHEGPEAADRVVKYQPLADLLVAYRAIAMVHQTHHWQTRGGHYYSDHLLFERLYNEVTALIDPLAERAVGLGHWTLVNAPTQAAAVAAIVSTMPGVYNSPEDMVEGSRQFALLMVASVEAIIQKLEATNAMTAGLDDLLPAHAGKFEEHAYLLGQRSS